MARRAGPKHSTSVEETYARGRMGALAALATLALVGTGAAGAFAATTIPQSDATSEDATPAVAMVADGADTPAVITEEPSDEVPAEGTTPVTPADPAPAPAPVPEVTTPTDTTAPTPTEPSKPAGEVSTTTDQPQTDTTSADEAEAQSLEAGIRPLTAGPESTVDPPYIYWDVRDTSNNLVQGASVRIAGPRSSSSNWGETITVLDNYGQAGYTGADLDPDRGEFLVKQIGSHNITSGSRYRIQRGDAPYGYSWSTNTNWIEMSSSPTWTNQTYDFDNLTLNKATTSNYTITVPKGTYRTGTASNAVNGTDTAGVKFGIFASQTATEPIHTCEIITANLGNCVFTNVALVQSQQVFVRELPPAAGSTAAQKLVPILTNFSTGDGPFMNQTYQYGFTPASTSTISIPTTSTDNGTTNSWGQVVTQPPYDAGSGYFANRVVNPTLTQTCDAGVKVAVVLDTSGSVNGYQDTLAKATTALVNGLTGTPSSVAMFSFAAKSPGAVTNHPEPQSVATTGGANTVKGWYSNDGGQTAKFIPSGGTNWDDGLWKTADSGYKYDIVFVLTDGNPTYSNNGRNRSGSGSMTTFRELERAVFSANAIKATGARVVTVGIGGNLSDDNLAAISGPVKFATGMGLNEFDYAVANWSELQGVLENFAQGLKCEATVTVEKLAKAASAENFTPASGWTFDFAQTGAASPPPGTSEGTTMTDGKYTWTLKFTNPTDTSDATLTEQLKPGWALEDIACTVNDANITLDELKAEVPGIGIGENVVCTFKNVQGSGSIEVTKRDKDGVDNPVLAGAVFQLWEDVNGDGKLDPGDKKVGSTVTTPTSGKASWSDLPFGKYLVEEVSPPPGYVLSIPSVQAFEVTANAPSRTSNFDNPRVKGSLLWKKIDDGSPANALGGSVWTLTPTSPSGPPVDIADCVSGSCAPAVAGQPYDSDPTPGQFKVENLSWGEYTLQEKTPPPGYRASATVHPIEIGPKSPAKLSWDLGDQVNTKIKGPNLPLTGGQSAALFTILGGGLLAGALALTAIRRRKGGAAHRA